MLLNAEQVGQKLKLSPYKVEQMVRCGILTDLGVTKVGSKWHQRRIDSREVQDYLREGAAPKATQPVPVVVEQPLKTNGGLGEHAYIVQPPAPVAAALSTTAGIHTRLTAIEDKIDQLLRLWV